MHKDEKAYTIAIVGPKEVISGFKALGVTTFPAETSEKALEAMVEIKNNVESDAADAISYALVILIESLAVGIASDDLRRVTKGALPAVVVLPGIEGSQGSGQAKLRELAEKAVGTDILS